MGSVANVCNLALRHVGSSIEIQNLDTEKSSEAGACRRFYTQARDEVFQDFPWPFATVTASLALVTNTPTPEWLYSYRYPADCVAFGRIIGLARNPTHDQRVVYRVYGDGSGGRLIYTDWPEAVAEYGTIVEDTSRWSPSVTQCVALLLAAYIGPSVTGGDPSKLSARAYQLYQLKRGEAQADAANEEAVDPPPESEFVTIRN